jgi:uncharacterized membrane protein YedE/YeeE
MQIDWTHFTALASAAGGAMIGVAAALLLLLNGRITGVSGIVGGLLRPSAGEIGWRLAFLAGLAAAPLAWGLVVTVPAAAIEASAPVLLLAGLAVGVGTRFGAGCTSGHGVCGISRLSPRSLAATGVFMATGFLTVYVVRHVLAA